MGNKIRAYIKKHPLLLFLIRSFKGYQTIQIEYSINPVPRYGYGKPPHAKLYAIINANREYYKRILQSFLKYEKYFLEIKTKGQSDSNEPTWINGWLPGLDSIAIYSFLAQNNPRIFMEVGSGNSTKFARKSIINHNLQTKIISIDPHPRAEVDSICDTVIRQPVESINLEFFDQLKAGDILYIDCSHTCFMNSDVTTIFLDILPRLASGVLVEFHDINLPYDYSLKEADRYYSEQYLLASYLLAKGNMFDIILPNIFISNDTELKQILSPIWNNLNEVEKHGCSFWIKIK